MILYKGGLLELGLECHLSDCSGVGEGQMTKKRQLSSWPTLAPHLKGAKHLVSQVLKRALLYPAFCLLPHHNRLKFSEDRIEKQYKQSANMVLASKELTIQSEEEH